MALYYRMHVNTLESEYMGIMQPTCEDTYGMHANSLESECNMQLQRVYREMQLQRVGAFLTLRPILLDTYRMHGWKVYACMGNMHCSQCVGAFLAFRSHSEVSF